MRASKYVRRPAARQRIGAVACDAPTFDTPVTKCIDDTTTEDMRADERDVLTGDAEPGVVQIDAWPLNVGLGL